MRIVIKGFVAVSVVAVSFLGGIAADTLVEAPRNLNAARWKLGTVPPNTLANLFAPARAQAQDSDLPPSKTYDAVLNTIRTHYASSTPSVDREKLGVTRLTYAAIEGMLASLGDRYTEFITPREYKEMLQEQSGNFVGIGARLDVTADKRILIVEPIEGSPAAKAGMLPGDIITAVDGKSMAGVPVDDVISKIRGEEGTVVRVTVDRKGKIITFSLKRAVVNTPLVESNMVDAKNRIGYIRLTAFYEQADTQFDNALSKLEKQDMRGLVFDLRDNPGGLLNMAQSIASRFIDSGPVVWIKQKSGRMESLDVEPGQRGKLRKGAYPVVVLVNGGSASASEIVAGAIQDSGVGQLVGTRTYGKGLVQTIIPLAGDAAVKITTQHYFTRNKHDINTYRDEEGKPIAGTGGIQPDIVVEFTDKDYAAQRDAIRKDPQNKREALKLDPQLQKAMELLQTKLK